MNGREHLGLGVATAGLVLWGVSATGTPLGLPGVAAGVVAVGLGSIAPDIDHPGATISSRLPATLIALGAMFIVVYLTFRVVPADGLFAGTWTYLLQLTRTLPMWATLFVVVGLTLLIVSSTVVGAMKHRGPMHSLLASGTAVVFAGGTCAALGIEPVYGILFGYGWLVHLMADAASSMGLPSLFWPFLVAERGINYRAFRLLLIPLLLFGLTGWYFLGSQAFRTPSSESSVTAPAPVASHGDVPLALQRLREAAPDVAAALSEPDSPVIVQTGPNTSYTWEYLRKVTDDQVAVKSITLTLDSGGRMIGVKE